jgi:putative glutamine amidotransferase
LGICRGVQVLNVAAGGSLVQHIPTDVRNALEHRRAASPWTIAHRVQLAAESGLGRLLTTGGASCVDVNSRHHQAVKHLAPGFVRAATSADGVIEAIERPASRYCLAVQWHPENFWRTGEFDWLFRSFVDACRQ